MHTLRSLASSTVGQKALAAASGLVLVAWILAHLLGNLTVFAGPAAADGYAAGLRRWWPLLWLVRVGLLLAAAVHVAATLALVRRARAARPLHAQRRPHDGAATFAARTMRVGGGLLLLFVVWHLLHLTFGVGHPHFVPGSVHANVTGGLRSPAVAAGYLLASGLLGLHLYHGLWSVLRSLGLRVRSARVLRRPVVAALTIATAIGFASVPLAVLAGVLR